MNIRDEIIKKQDELINHFKNYFHPIDSKCFDKSRQEINRITIEFISEIVSLKAELEKEKEEKSIGQDESDWIKRQGEY